jgi:hypothetical protein
MQHGELLGHDQASGGAAESCILWAWNGVDTSQFAAAPLLPAAGGFTISGVPALTVVAKPEGNRLKLAVAGAAQRGVVVWPVALTEALDLPMRYLVRFSMSDGQAAGGTVTSGIYFYCDGEVALGSSHGIGYTVADVQTFFGVNTAGVWVVGGALFIGPSQPNLIELEVRGQKIGNDPGGNLSMTQWAVNAKAGASILISDATYFTAGFPAGWNALTAANLNQFGMCLNVVAANANPSVEFGMVEVLTHPLDRT